MKKWTVMLIPHDHGSTRTLTLSTVHYWVVVGLFCALAFSSAFFYQRHRVAAKHTEELQAAYAAAAQEYSRTRDETPASRVTESDTEAVELRAEYEASIAAITAELSALHDMEAKARNITGLAPRGAKTNEAGRVDLDGKGGSPAGPAGSAFAALDDSLRPPEIIYGMSRPSADLILQEIRLRTRSFQDLVSDMEAQIDRIERVPSIWPLAGGEGWISSSFGYRKDPFSKRMRPHYGTDIAALSGTKVLCTAKGIVTEATYDSGLGNLIKIDHGNGMETAYAHLKARLVKVGDTVKREDVIGTVGSTGRTTGPHLHYEIHVDGKPINGRKFITD